MKEEQERTPLRTILQNFLNHIENLDRISDDSYDKEFQSLKQFSENLKSVKQYSCTEGEKDVNRRKNRYKDILPFDYTRVILSGIHGIHGSDYVNANFIKGASGSLAYIASQGPLSHTANDFWRMIVECEVQVIVMACNEEESGKHKCEHYWVDHEGEEKQFGLATIRLIKASVVCPDFLVRTMQLKYKKDDTVIERTICQFHYSAWPDHGVPPLVRPLLDMVRLVRDTQASETLPVLIHCSAGCGRTGTICAIDYVWGLLRAGKLTADFSLLKLVRDMRKQRIAMVQTKDQYILVHKAVRELFQEQLKMIDAHPYENVDLNGIPLMKEEPMYELVRNDEFNEKQDKKEKDVILPCNMNKPSSNQMKEAKVVLTPPFPVQKSLSYITPSKREKEVENLTQKQLAGISSWTKFDDTACSSAADSGLSASSTDSSCTLTSLPKRCPLPLPFVETRTVDQVVQDDSSSSSSPSVSSLLQKPRIAKLKALFERSSKSAKLSSQGGKSLIEADCSPKARTSQQVTRSHSLGAVRKPRKFTQFQSSDTPVALYKKLFATKESQETNEKNSKHEQSKVKESSGTASVSKSDLLEERKPVQKECVPKHMNVQHESKPALPIKRSKSLKVVGNVDRSYFPMCQNYSLLQTQEKSATHKEQFYPIQGVVELQSKPADVTDNPVPRERTKKLSEIRSKETQAAKLLPHSNLNGSVILPPAEPSYARNPQISKDKQSSKEYVNILELKSNWHQETNNLPMACSGNDPSKGHQSRLLDEGTQKIIEDCRQYLMISQDLGKKESDQFDQLSAETQRDIKSIVGGIGIRERRHSFRRAVCHDGDASKRSPKRNVKDYEAIWLPGEPRNKAPEHWVQFGNDMGPDLPHQTANSKLNTDYPAPVLSTPRKDELRSTLDKSPRSVQSRPQISKPEMNLSCHENYGVIKQLKLPNAQSSGPSAPPRVKRNTTQSDMLRPNPEASKDPVYVNAESIKNMKDAWHGAPGVDLDAVAASIKKPSQSEHSTPLTRAFEKIHSKASNFRTKLSPKNEMESPVSRNEVDSDSRLHQERSPNIAQAAKASSNQGTAMPAMGKQQQYL